jgi:hypothetical protein
MAPNTKKALLVIAAVAALIICFVVLRPSSPPQLTPAQLVQNANLATDKGKTKRKYDIDKGKTKRKYDIVLKGGKPVGGLVKLDYRKNSTVMLSISSDQAGSEIHVHGYELKAVAGPGKPAQIIFVADKTGRFEIELHPSTPIAQLDITP